VLRIDAKTDGGMMKSPKRAFAPRPAIPIRYHRFRHRFRCHDRPAEGLEPERPRRPHLDEQWADGQVHLPWHLGRRFPQLVYHHARKAWVGAVEYAGYRAACGVVTDRIDTMRKTGKTTIEATPQAQEYGCACQRDRQHDADDRRYPGT
jgi:hypothetical protein